MELNYYTVIASLLVSTLGAAPAAYGLFQFLGKSWIESKFERQLQELKHKQAQELHRLRVEIDSTLSATLKLQEKEFEVLPEAWRLLNITFGATASISSPIQTYPDLDRKTTVEIEEILSSTDLLDSQKDRIRNSNEKGKQYLDEFFWLRLQNAEKSRQNLQNYLSLNGIFFPPSVKEMFQKILLKLNEAISGIEVYTEFGDWKERKKIWNTLQDDIRPTQEEIERIIIERLRSHSADKPV